MRPTSRKAQQPRHQTRCEFMLKIILKTKESKEARSKLRGIFGWPGCASAASRAHRRSPASGHRWPTSCSRGMSPREPGQRVVRATKERQTEANFGEFNPRD